jgi:hypothetical protein
MENSENKQDFTGGTPAFLIKTPELSIKSEDDQKVPIKSEPDSRTSDSRPASEQPDSRPDIRYEPPKEPTVIEGLYLPKPSLGRNKKKVYKHPPDDIKGHGRPDLYVQAIEGLNENQIAFATYYVELGSTVKACELAGYSKKSSDTIGGRLLKQPKIQRYIQYVRDVNALKAGITRGTQLAKINKFLEVAYQKKDVSGAAKLIDLECKITGLYAPVKSELKSEITVAFGTEEPVDITQIQNQQPADTDAGSDVGCSDGCSDVVDSDVVDFTTLEQEPGADIQASEYDLDEETDNPTSNDED